MIIDVNHKLIILLSKIYIYGDCLLKRFLRFLNEPENSIFIRKQLEIKKNKEIKYKSKLKHKSKKTYDK